MDLFVAGRDQSAADQPNNLAEGHLRPIVIIQTDADFISYPRLCSDLDKLPCVQNDRTWSTRRAPVP